MNDATILPPHNIDLEQALLGAILTNNDAFWRVSDFLEPGHFFEPIHGQIFEIMGSLIRAGRAAMPQTLLTFLPERLTPDLSMKHYLAAMAAHVVSVLNAADFGGHIRDLAVRRRLRDHAAMVNDLAQNAGSDQTAPQLIELVEKDLFAIAERGGSTSGVQSFSAALVKAIDMAGKAYQRDGHLSGIATGLHDLDKLMGGLQRSDLIILAGRPAMGKTSLATNIAFHVASSFRSQYATDGTEETVEGGRVLFFSLEMSSEQLATRILAEQSQIASSDIRRGYINEDKFSRIVDVSNNLNRLPLNIDDTGGLNIAQLCARARRQKRQGGVDLIVVDYLQLVTGSSGRARENRVQELTEITTSLKALAKELDVPVVALSQLSRQVESRDDKRPQLADLRESGSIEQDADVVLFVFREEYYLKLKEPKEGSPAHIEWEGEMERARGRAEVIVSKQRHGPTGTVPLAFEAYLTRFSDIAKPAAMEPIP